MIPLDRLIRSKGFFRYNGVRGEQGCRSVGAWRPPFSPELTTIPKVRSASSAELSMLKERLHDTEIQRTFIELLSQAGSRSSCPGFPDALKSKTQGRTSECDQRI